MVFRNDLISVLGGKNILLQDAYLYGVCEVIESNPF